jgi:hypothetical protein
MYIHRSSSHLSVMRIAVLLPRKEGEIYEGGWPPRSVTTQVFTLGLTKSTEMFDSNISGAKLLLYAAITRINNKEANIPTRVSYGMHGGKYDFPKVYRSGGVQGIPSEPLTNGKADTIAIKLTPGQMQADQVPHFDSRDYLWIYRMQGCKGGQLTLIESARK